MPTYETPGVYNERSDSSSGGISALRTDVAGFAGIASRGPLHLAVPVESIRQFEAWFGGATDQGYLAYSARAFFENGGRRLWAVRVASELASTAAVVVNAKGGPAWRIEASSPGVWGNALAVRVAERRRIQRRGRTDDLDRDVLHIGSTAGLERRTLLEVRAAGVHERAVVQDAQPDLGTVRLQRPLTLIGPGTRVEVDTVSWQLDVFEAGTLVAQAGDVSIVPGHPRYGPSVLRMPWTVIDPERPDEAGGRAPDADLAVDYFRIGRNRASVTPPRVVIRELRDRPTRDALDLLDGADGRVALSLGGGLDGLAALQVTDFIGDRVPPTSSNELIAAGRRGLAALAIVDEVAIIAVPDIHIQPRPIHVLAPPPVCEPDLCIEPVTIPAIPVVAPVGDLPPRFDLRAIGLVHDAMVDQCEQLRDRVAILDAPLDAVDRLTFAATELREWRMRFESTFAGLYAPWVLVVDPLRDHRGTAAGLTRAIPPSGHVAGGWAAVDLRQGVHVAGANRPLQWVQGVTLAFDDAMHGLLNSLGVNVIRARPGFGVRVLGARSLSSDPDWRFLSTRRLFAMVEEAIDESIQWAVFEPNDWRTRLKLTLVIRSFLGAMWSRGAMVGATPDEGFFVRCDETNNPPSTRDLGHLQIDVGIAATTPFEFIVLRIGRDANGFAISDRDPLLATG
jgi:phage tail sheath protein FI